MSVCRYSPFTFRVFAPSNFDYKSETLHNTMLITAPLLKRTKQETGVLRELQVALTTATTGMNVTTFAECIGYMSSYRRMFSGGRNTPAPASSHLLAHPGSTQSPPANFRTALTSVHRLLLSCLCKILGQRNSGTETLF